MAIGKTASAILIAAAFCAGAEVKFAVRHEHLRKGCYGNLTVTDTGVSFAGPKKHAWSWRYQDIQQLTLARGRITVLTYRDNRLKLGADRQYEFTGEVPAGELYPLWTSRLDQRFVAEIPDRLAIKAASLRIPVKHLRRVKGSEGYLEIGPDALVYSTDAKDEARTWRYSDIDSISSSGPFQLTITSFERARLHYGDRKGFNFQLKEPLSEARYDQLWLRIQKKNGKIQ